MRRFRLLLCVFFLASAARAAEIASFELYAAASRGWTGAIGAALVRPPAAQPLSSTLTALAAPSLAPARAFAPVAVHLETSLALKPEAFAALPPADQRAALELAVDAARADLQQKVYELDARSHALSAPDRALDKDGQTELYANVTQLNEMRAHYGAYLDQGARDAVEAAYSRSFLRAAQLRNQIIGLNAGRVAVDLSGAGRDAPPLPAGAAAAPALTPENLPGVSAGAVKLYERMNATTAGWGADDVDSLLTGYGFARRDGKHRNYSHPDFPDLADSFSHQRVLKDVYVKSAVRLVRELARRRASAAAAAAAPAAAPTVVTLDDLKILVADSRPKKTRAAPEAAGESRAPASAAPAPIAAARARAAAEIAPRAATPAAEDSSAPAAPARRPGRLEPADPARAAEPKTEPPAPRPAKPPLSNWDVAKARMRRLLGLDP